MWQTVFCEQRAFFRVGGGDDCVIGIERRGLVSFLAQDRAFLDRVCSMDPLTVRALK